MQVKIADTPDNWRKWGALVSAWVFGTTPLPADTAEMKTQMAAAGVQGSVPGPTRGVMFVPYNNEAPLVFPLPTPKMVETDLASLRQIAEKPEGQRCYPIPSFYNAAYGSAKKVDLTREELLAMGDCRLGEYTIQECQ